VSLRAMSLPFLIFAEAAELVFVSYRKKQLTGNSRVLFVY